MVNKKDLDELYERMATLVKRENKKLKDEIFEKMEEKMNEKIKCHTEDIFGEVSHREENKKNVVIYGLKEENEDEELDKLLKLLGEETNEDLERDVKIKFRLGKDRKRERPLKVVFFCAHSAELALKHAKKLKYKEGYDHVFVSEDLTVQQLQRTKELKEKAKNWNEEKKDLNKGEKWILVGRRTNPQLKKITCDSTKTLKNA